MEIQRRYRGDIGEIRGDACEMQLDLVGTSASSFPLRWSICRDSSSMIALVRVRVRVRVGVRVRVRVGVRVRVRVRVRVKG